MSARTELQERVDGLRRRFQSYDGGDRPMSPPVSLIRELNAAEAELVAMPPDPAVAYPVAPPPETRPAPDPSISGDLRGGGLVFVAGADSRPPAFEELVNHIFYIKLDDAKRTGLMATAVSSVEDFNRRFPKASFHDLEAVCLFFRNTECRALDVIHDPPPKKECPDCEDGAYIKSHCAHCEGPIYVTCETCKGTGAAS
jgi:hypothetical protein